MTAVLFFRTAAYFFCRLLFWMTAVFIVFWMTAVLFFQDDSQTEKCVSALLEASVRHGPHFDWVVAHVGGCFPDTVISR